MQMNSRSRRSVAAVSQDVVVHFGAEPLEPRRLLSAAPHMIADLNPVADTSNLNAGIAFKGKVYCWVDDGVHGLEFWVTDGTASGTKLVKDINPGPASSYPAFFQVMGGALYFRANDGVHGEELWRSDGTAKGTKMVRDVAPGLADSSPYALTLIDDRQFLFIADSPATGSELWRSDGTGSGTVLVKDICPGEPGSNLYQLMAFGKGILFTAYDGKHGRQLWKSDGTRAGTKMMKEIAPRDLDWVVYGMGRAGDLAFFTINDGKHGYELWKTDGTSAGTQLVKDLVPGSSDSSPDWYRSIGDTLYFTAYVGEKTGVWKSDGTAAGTVCLTTSLWMPENLTAVGNDLYFTSGDPKHGYELWKSDGTPAGTRMVKDIQPGTEGSYPYYLTPIGNHLYFTANDGVHGYELWVSDGTAAGTTLVADLKKGAEASLPEPFLVVKNRVYFNCDDGIHGNEPWILDEPMGSISGRVFADQDQDGKKDVDESWLKGRTVYLDLDNDKTKDANEPSAVTNTKGQYTINELLAGDYNVRQVLPEHWAQSTPRNDNGVKVHLRAGQLYQGALHGSYFTLGSISGRVFSDLDLDGRFDAEELPLQDRKVFADLDNDRKLDADEPFAVTNERGWYTLKDLPGGDYNIRQILPAGWMQTTPKRGQGIKVHLLSGQNRSGLLHGASLASGVLTGSFKAGSGKYDLVPNGGFESGLNSWDEINTDRGMFSTSTGSAIAGKRSAVAIPFLFDGQAGFALGQNISVTPGETYFLSGWVNTSKDGGGSAYLDLGDAWFEPGGGPSGILARMNQPGAQFMYAAFVVPEDVSSVEVRVVRDGYVGPVKPGVPTWFDDIAITPASRFQPPQVR